MVPGVAKSPIVLVRLAAAAGLIAGTTPTIGTEDCCLRGSRATVLAVLQAITTKSGEKRSIVCLVKFVMHLMTSIGVLGP